MKTNYTHKTVAALAIIGLIAMVLAPLMMFMR
jgi:hypothetical protein